MSDKASISLPLIIGHRGASSIAPENTMAAFRQAIEQGANGLEFDVRLARDGVPVVIHDDNLKRTASRNLKVSALSSTELAGIDVGSWFNKPFPQLAKAEFEHERIPVLSDVLQTFGPLAHALYIELKCDEGETEKLAAETVELIRAFALTDRSIVESFSLAAIREVKRLAPEIRTAALFERTLVSPAPSYRRIIEQALECDASELALHHSLVTRKIVDAARSEKLNVLVWTVDKPSWVQRAIFLGLSALITNCPATMIAALDRL